MIKKAKLIHLLLCLLHLLAEPLTRGCHSDYMYYLLVCFLQAADSQIVSDYVRYFLHQHT